MGLDQYAYKVKRDVVHLLDLDEELRTLEQDEKLEAGHERIAYWRKHANLQEWFVQYSELEDINCEKIWIDEHLLDELESDVKTRNLPHGVGFFWGESDTEDRKLDLAFIKKARKALKEGYLVYYLSWF